MAAKIPEYPFLPKSTAFLRPGMFWDIRLRDGSYACGRVLQIEGEIRKRRPFIFFGGLLRWHGSEPPTVDTIAGIPVLWQGDFYVRSLAGTDSLIRDCVPPDSDSIEIPPMLTTTLNGRVMVGYNLFRDATDEEFRTLPTKTLGVSNESFREIAEDVFLEGKQHRWAKAVDDDNRIRDLFGMKTPADLIMAEEKARNAWRSHLRLRATEKKLKNRTRRPTE